jgi:hypothetical protein
MTPDTDIAIVLTGAIIVSSGADAVAEATVRREQYLTALRYYARFVPVYFWKIPALTFGGYRIYQPCRRPAAPDTVAGTFFFGRHQRCACSRSTGPHFLVLTCSAFSVRTSFLCSADSS